MLDKPGITDVVDVMDIDEINNDNFDSGDDVDDITTQRKKRIRELMQQEGESNIGKTFFYVGQTFSTKHEFKQQSQLHAMESKREIVLVKNDDRRLKGVCWGERSDQEKSWRKREMNIECPWEIYVSKVGKSETWQVKTFHDEHKCLFSRDILQCTYEFLASKLVDKIPSNPNLPTKAVKVQFESEYGVNITKQKAYRALKHNCDPDLPTRVFKRVYISLCPLKKGFKALGTDLIGLDGAFMKEPTTGHVLTTFGVDSNNGIYPVAYAIVESQSCNSWSQFLDYLGKNLELNKRSNFTFISDRQKGLINAVERIYPSAKHRFCLRHLQQNMKKNWNGKAYKDHLWRCATTTTVPKFELCMQDLRRFNKGCWDYLVKIKPQHWARSHFSGRAKTDILLNNMCEVLNRWLVDGRDKPIITALEFIREYLMKRIVNVHNTISKCSGPLTPGATKVFEGIKKEAEKYTVMFIGSNKYQVNGPHDDQCVVHMEHTSCVCRK
ncbi:uncharacterized protein [Rutidosis leptorrhynchoides]|uniref:uncharacterized protein n=1 Tax=Rutidosis leptorrhynchoides TaxID=125765 RepID=UPI003A997E5D